MKSLTDHMHYNIRYKIWKIVETRVHGPALSRAGDQIWGTMAFGIEGQISAAIKFRLAQEERKI